MKAKHEYVVGFVGDIQCVYGKDATPPQYIEKLTLHQAKKRLKQMVYGRKTIYKLVPVKK